MMSPHRLPRGSRPAAVLCAALVVATCGAAAKPTPQPAASPSGQPSPGASASACPSLTSASSVDPSFLGTASKAPVDGLVVEVLVGPETGEADLGKGPIWASFALSGPLPADDAPSRAAAFTAGSLGECAVRVLIDRGELTPSKGTPLLVELDVPGRTLSSAAGSAGHCTWLPTDRAQSAGLECIGMTGADGSGPAARVWIRLAWSGTAAGLPDWAVAALRPAPTPIGSPGALALVPVESSSFAMTDPPFHDGSTFTLRGLAHGPTGWVAAGAWDQPSAGNVMSSGDVAAWWSAEGRSWRRVDSAAVFGGPGYQTVQEVVAEAGSWWIVGLEYSGSPDNPLVGGVIWHSTDGQRWQRLPGAFDGTPTKAVPDGAGGLVVAGYATSGEPSAWVIDGAGHLLGSGALPMPTGLQGDAKFVGPVDIDAGPGGYVILGMAPLHPDPSGQQPNAVAWTSHDGRTWTLLTGQGATKLSALLGPNSLARTSLGWVVGGIGQVARSSDLSSWQIATIGNGAYFVALAEHRGSVVALGEGQSPIVLASANGSNWSPVDVGDGPRPDPFGVYLAAVASDGTTLVVVGSRAGGPGIWTDTGL